MSRENGSKITSHLTKPTQAMIHDAARALFDYTAGGTAYEEEYFLKGYLAGRLAERNSPEVQGLVAAARAWIEVGEAMKFSSPQFKNMKTALFAFENIY